MVYYAHSSVPCKWSDERTSDGGPVGEAAGPFLVGPYKVFGFLLGDMEGCSWRALGRVWF